LRRAGVLLAALLAAAACTHQKSESARALPTGDAVWFEDGIGPDEGGIEETLEKAGLGAVFLPAIRLSRESGHWVAQQLPLPPRPMARTKVFLSLSGTTPRARPCPSPGAPPLWERPSGPACSPHFAIRGRTGPLRGFIWICPSAVRRPGSTARL